MSPGGCSQVSSNIRGKPARTVIVEGGIATKSPGLKTNTNRYVCLHPRFVQVLELSQLLSAFLFHLLRCQGARLVAPVAG